MKKSCMLLASAAVMALSGQALALDAFAPGGYNAVGASSIRDASMPGPFGLLGTVDGMTPLGSAGTGDCFYALTWRSPLALPGGASALCILREAANAFAPGGCAVNSAQNITTAVQAGPQVGQVCNGYNAAGTPAPIQLFLQETAGGGVGRLSGVAIYPGAILVPLATF